MKNKKHIDRVFQEKLKDLEFTPDSSVWQNLSNSLHKEKKDRKPILIWWQLGGIAAALLLLLTVGGLIIKDTNKPTVVDTEQKDINKTESDIKNNNVDYVDVDKQNENTKNANTENTNKESFNSTQQSTSVASYNAKNNTTKTGKTASKKSSTNKASQIANSQQNTTSPSTNNTIINNQNNNSQNPVSNDVKNAIVETNQEEKPNLSENYKSDKNIVDQNEREKTPLTEDLVLNEEQTDEKEKYPINRWQISPNVAPVYFNTLGQGSSIDGQFNNNPKSGNINLSYGINVSYAINNKLSIKTGINNVKLSYDTDNVLVVESLASTARTSAFSNIKVNNPSNITFISENNLSLAQVPETLNSPEFSSFLNQELGFIEVPLEVKYNLIDKKLGVNVISGLSFLFLNDNNIYSVINGSQTLLGEATNINKTSYSANIGLGLDYDVSKTINLNLEPMFKYQINTFNNTSGDFQPYFIGVYSGVNIKF